MLTWICPDCNCECAPSDQQCPECSDITQAGVLSLARSMHQLSPTPGWDGLPLQGRVATPRPEIRPRRGIAVFLRHTDSDPDFSNVQLIAPTMVQIPDLDPMPVEFTQPLPEPSPEPQQIPHEQIEDELVKTQILPVPQVEPNETLLLAAATPDAIPVDPETVVPQIADQASTALTVAEPAAPAAIVAEEPPPPVPVAQPDAPAPPPPLPAVPPAHSQRRSGLLVSILVAAALILGGVAFVRHMQDRTQAATTTVNAAPPEPESPLAHYVEVTGVRLVNEPKPHVQFIVISHAPVELDNLTLRITLRSGNNPQPIGTVSTVVTGLQPSASREMSSDVPGLKGPAPSWQDLKTDVLVQ